MEKKIVAWVKNNAFFLIGEASLFLGLVFYFLYYNLSSVGYAFAFLSLLLLSFLLKLACKKGPASSAVLGTDIILIVVISLIFGIIDLADGYYNPADEGTELLFSFIFMGFISAICLFDCFRYFSFSRSMETAIVSKSEQKNNDRILPPIHLDEKQRQELKNDQLAILDAFTRFCDENGLTYFLFGGTLLGAVRHEGYIPWDDDLDLCMPSEDYYKMLDLFPKEGEFYLECRKTDENYIYHFAKIMEKGTVYREFAYQNSKAHQGIFIDVFPIYNIPSKKRKLRWAWFYFWLGVFYCRSTPKALRHGPKVKGRWIRNLLDIPSAILLFWCPRSHAALLRDKWLEKHSWTFTGEVSCGARLNSCYPADFFEPYCLVSFEGRQLKAPKDYGRYLAKKYGSDYMLPPPEADREAHHYVVEFRSSESETPQADKE